MATPEPDIRCQCNRWQDEPCRREMTQEDLLCDHCRGTCSLLRLFDGKGNQVSASHFGPILRVFPKSAFTK